MSGQDRSAARGHDKREAARRRRAEQVAATTEPLAALTRTQMKCPYCKRTVETWNDPERGKLMYGHRTSAQPTHATPWCEGGGRNVGA